MPAETIHDVFTQASTLYAERRAVVDGDKVLSFRELEQQSTQVARTLLSIGVSPCRGTPVGMCLSGSLSVVALLGILKTGNPYLPLDPEYPQPRVKYMVEDAGVLHIATTTYVLKSGVLKGPWFAGTTLEMDSDWARAIAVQSATPLGLHVEGSAVAYVLYTSGSSGFPKGVLGPHSASLNRFRWNWRAYPYTDDDVCVQKTSYSFVDHVFETLGPLCAGIPLVICPKAARTDAGLLLQLLSTHAVTRLICVPSLLRLLVQSKPPLGQRLPALRHCISSGEALSWDLAEAFHTRTPHALLVNLYGSTEVAGDVTCFEAPHSRPTNSCSTQVPVGWAIDNTTVELLDDQLTRTQPGEVGKVVVFGLNLASGYLRPDSSAAARFVRVRQVPVGGRQDGYSPPGYSIEEDKAGVQGDGSQRAFFMGDLATFDASGSLCLVGRTDQQVKIHGNRVDLLEVESQLSLVEGVYSACVVVREEPKRIVAFVSPAEVPVDRLMAHLKAVLPAYMLPSKIWALDALPLLPNGKLDRQLMFSMAQSGQLRGKEMKRNGVLLSAVDAQPGACTVDRAELARLLQRLAHQVLTQQPDGTAAQSPPLSAAASSVSDAPEPDILPVDVPLATLGFDSMDAMIFKQAVVKELADRHPTVHFPPEALTLDYTMFEWLTLHTLRCQLEACMAGQHRELSQADVSAPIVILERDCRKPLAQLCPGGITACAAGDLAMVRQLVESGEWDADHAVDRNNSTALLWASGNGHLEVAKYLLQNSRIDVNASNKQQRTALMQAAKGGHLAVVRWLLEEVGADLHRTMKDGSRVFDWAVMGGSLEVVNYLASRPDVDIYASNVHECTAVHWATATGNVEMCRWLYARGFDFAALNKSNHSALNQAAWKGHRRALEWLLLDPDGPKLTNHLSLIDHGGLTVVELARLAGHLPLADWLEAVTRNVEGF